MGQTKIKPCPLCGGQVFVNAVDQRQAYRVRCRECGATGPKVFIQSWHRDRFIAQGQAIKKWNERKHPLSHVSMIEFTEMWPSTGLPMVALLNNEHLTEEEALKVIRNGCVGYSPYLVVIHKEQYEKLFLNQNGGKKHG